MRIQAHSGRVLKFNPQLSSLRAQLHAQKASTKSAPGFPAKLRSGASTSGRTHITGLAWSEALKLAGNLRRPDGCLVQSAKALDEVEEAKAATSARRRFLSDLLILAKRRFSLPPFPVLVRGGAGYSRTPSQKTVFLLLPQTRTVLTAWTFADESGLAFFCWKCSAIAWLCAPTEPDLIQGAPGTL